jgi:polyribonucleotide 5'-hydroxyl-kinase
MDLFSKNEIFSFQSCTHVDMEKKEISVLSPSPGKLPSKYLILGTLKWVDQS